MARRDFQAGRLAIRCLHDVLENRASFYAIDGRLRAADYRKVWTVQGQPSNTWWWDTWFEEFRYDALGRRVLVRQRKNCLEQGNGPLHWCTLSWIRRTVWDGGEELYEIQMPGGNEVNADTLENDTLFIERQPAQAPPYLSYFDANPQHGRVAYLHATGTDVPLSIVRINYEDQPWSQIYQTWEPFVVVPHWNWREHAEYGTYGDGSYKHCKSFNPDRCVQVQWMTKAFAFQDPASDTLDSWIGTLTQEKRDATGTHYRRNRYVDLSTGRFTQEDPIGLAGGLNLYGFAGGDAVNFSDPFGLCPPETPWTPDCDMPLASAGLLDPTAWLSGGLVGGLRLLGGRIFGRAVVTATADVTATTVPTASNAALQNTLRALFRSGDEIAGGTAGAIRNEAITGQPTKGVWHLRKGIERIANLKRILRRERLNDADRATAERVLADLEDAVRFAQERAKQQ